ncbi:MULTISPECIES: D-aminoacyl-tRNA deacylase [Haloarcula]|uniref:D-aminoacyl-tRNA deacylase n=1 Tax=Haloarcula TaxID=2237 RepID=UPI0023EC2C07|nr:D-aminoacyl-tRNA deacylase [Halomicroarcula sp. XH51]
MLAIVVSRADEASVHIGECLLDVEGWTTHTDEGRPDGEGGGTVYRREGVELRVFDDSHVDIAAPADAFDDPDLLVFASKHAGKTGPLLTAHHTGNFGAAEYGGAAGRFARACPNALRAVVDAMDEHAPAEYDVGIECTHHGPTDVGVPSMFVEVGSAEPQWEDPEAAAAVARAILDLADIAADAPPENGTRRHLLGVGGGHYAPRFERVIRETDWAVGHVAADWGLEALSEWADDETAYEGVLRRAFAASAADVALLEDDRPDLVATVESLGYRVVDETFVRATTGVPLDLVETLEREIASVDAGLRFGDPANGFEGDWTVVDLPAALLAEARGIDDAAVRELVEAEAVAFATEQSGTVVTTPVVCPADVPRDRLLGGLADVLRDQYDSVEREGGTLVARETTFDPELARTAGVPEGPKFGQLAAGQSVEVDGEEIGPERFQRERIRRFTL